MSTTIPPGIRLEQRFYEGVERVKLKVPDDAPLKRQVELVRDAYDGTVEVGSVAWKSRWVPQQVQLHLARVAAERFLEAVETLGDLPGLKKIVKERVIVGSIAQDFERSQAKDALYELEIATTMRLAGFEVRLAEPDIVISGSGLGRDVALACKYPSSRDRLNPLVSEAYKQIERRGVNGVVCIGMDLIVAKETSLHGRLDFRRSRWSPEEIQYDRLMREIDTLQKSRARDYPAEKPLDRVMMTVAFVGLEHDLQVKHLQSSALGCSPGHVLKADLDLIAARINEFENERELRHGGIIDTSFVRIVKPGSTRQPPAS